MSDSKYEYDHKMRILADRYVKYSAAEPELHNLLKEIANELDDNRHTFHVITTANISTFTDLENRIRKLEDRTPL